MKPSVWILLLLAVAGCHGRDDAGPFVIIADKVTPLHGHPLRHLVHRKPILLSFDDGPEDLATDRSILATLRKHGARAIWLVTCRRLDPAMDPRAAEHRQALREIVEHGDLLGNHGYSHVDLTRLDDAALRHEIVDCSQLIRTMTGIAPVYFRPPFGRHDARVDQAVASSGMQLLLWTGNSFDSLLASFKQQPRTFAPFLASHPAYEVAEQATAGDVVLFHDYPNTAMALDGILTRLEDRSFQFVTPLPSGDRKPAPGVP